jgi:hypothetical protein
MDSLVKEVRGSGYIFHCLDLKGFENPPARYQFTYLTHKSSSTDKEGDMFACNYSDNKNHFEDFVKRILDK